MIRYFSRILVAHFRTRPSLYLLTIFGVALGVASVLSIQIINRNALAAFMGSVAAVSGDADLTILGRTPTFPEELYPDVLAIPGVRAAWPLVRFDVAVMGRENLFLEVVGVDFFAPMDIPWQGDKSDDLSKSMSMVGWIAITPTLADQWNWKVGDTVPVSIGTRVVLLSIGALVDFQALTPLASPTLVVMDIAQAQSLLGRPGRLHQIDVRLVDSLDRATVQVRLQERLGESVRVLTPEQRKQQAQGLLGAFRLNLTALSLISLFVGMFLVYSSTQAALVRRREEFGLLRSLGATRRQVLGLIISEIVILGGVGVVFGLPMGYWVAQANMEVVSGTLTNLYLLEAISTLEMTWWLYGLGILIGVGGAVLGALVPSLDMSRRDTRSLLSALTLHEKVSSLAPYSFGLGIGLLALASGWYWTLGRQWQHAGFVLGISLLTSIPLTTPLAIREICGRVRVHRFGLGYSLKGIAAQLQTSAFAVASLAVAVTMLIGITLMIGSFRRTLEVWISTSIQADLYITPESWRGSGSGSGVEQGVIERAWNHPGVEAVDRLRRFTGYTGDQRVGITGVDMDISPGADRFPLLSGDSLVAYYQAVEQEAVFLGETLARKLDLWVGDAIPLYTANGVHPFVIAAVYYDYSTEGGMVIMDLRTLVKRFGPGPINSVALYLRPGFEAERAVDEFKAIFAEMPLQIRSNQRLRREVLQIFDQTFAVTRLLQVMSLLIAACGITLMLLVLAREQSSELALYRSIGASRLQIFGMFLGKGLGMGLMGWILGAVGGVFLAGLLIYVINRDYFGWTIQPYVPWWAIVQQSMTILAAAGLASLYPALRASRIPATELSRDL